MALSARTKTPCRFGRAFAVLATLVISVSLSQVAWAGEGTEVVVRVDDRAPRALSQPWLTVQVPGQDPVDAPVYDNGTDPLDLFPGDRYYFGRVEVPGEGPAVVILTDGGPVGSGRLVDKVVVTLRPGGEIQQRFGSAAMLLPSDAGESSSQDSSQGENRPMGGHDTVSESIWSLLPSLRAEEETELPWSDDLLKIDDSSWDLQPWYLIGALLAVLAALWRTLGVTGTGLPERVQRLAKGLAEASVDPRTVRRRNS